MFNESNNDLTVLYQGGSGGFFFYFLLLLSGKYISGDPFIINCEDKIWAVKQRILQQFPKTLELDRSKWKTFEFWPDNDLCKNIQTSQKKLYLFCNPTFDRATVKNRYAFSNGTDVVLYYTNLSTQLRMSFEKNAYWFTPVSRKRFNAPDSNYKYLKKIRKNNVMFRGVTVEKELETVYQLFKPKFVISLADILKNQLELNTDQQWLVDHWVSLQSSKTKRLICEI